LCIDYQIVTKLSGTLRVPKWNPKWNPKGSKNNYLTELKEEDIIKLYIKLEFF